jgi:DNA replication and repair protein RecF
MPLTKLEIQRLRNLSQLKLEPCAGINLIYGANGSGKTSILEAIYLLGLGRSFRSRNVNHLIQTGQDALTVFGLLQQGSELAVPLGIKRSKDGSIQIRIQEDTVNSIAELAHYLPLQLINQDSYLLLSGSPKVRRQFLDWALFHVEHSFYPLWKRFNRCLQQRNAALRNKANKQEIGFWDKEFIQAAEQLTLLRNELLVKYTPFFQQVLMQITTLEQINLTYKQGWHNEQDLAHLLAENYQRDIQLGFTQDGPHRADLDIKIGKTLASQVLSRGQQKMLTYSLQLAQGLLLKQLVGRTCIYLIDDMPAELDQAHIEAVLQFFNTVQSQLFMTCVFPEQITSYLKNEVKTFHVEHGESRFM